MTTAALIKEIRERNKEIIAGLEATNRLLNEVLRGQQELITAQKTPSRPAVPELQKGAR